MKNRQHNQQSPNLNTELETIYAPKVGETNKIIKEEKGVYKIEYESAKRVGKMIDKKDLLAWAQFLEYIRIIGAQAALIKSGAKQGDIIMAGEISWIME
mgnify:CR=1 FL=1